MVDTCPFPRPARLPQLLRTVAAAPTSSLATSLSRRPPPRLPWAGPCPPRLGAGLHSGLHPAATSCLGWDRGDSRDPHRACIHPLPDTLPKTGLQPHAEQNALLLPGARLLEASLPSSGGNTTRGRALPSSFRSSSPGHTPQGTSENRGDVVDANKGKSRRHFERTWDVSQTQAAQWTESGCPLAETSPPDFLASLGKVTSAGHTRAVSAAAENRPRPWLPSQGTLITRVPGRHPAAVPVERPVGNSGCWCPAGRGTPAWPRAGDCGDPHPTPSSRVSRGMQEGPWAPCRGCVGGGTARAGTIHKVSPGELAS